MSNDYINSIKARADALRSLSADIVSLPVSHRSETIEMLQREARYIDVEASDAEKAQALQDIGASAMASIAEMVAALECDYDRLEELKAERADWLSENPGSYLDPNDPRATAGAHWALAFPDEAEELAELRKAAGECESREDAEQRIQEDALSVEVRSGWVSYGCQEDMRPEEFRLLLSTGGPATRIIGELNEHGEPTRARLQAQDWGTSWTDYRGADQDTLLTYARCFYFGEG